MAGGLAFENEMYLKAFFSRSAWLRLVVLGLTAL